MTEINSEQIFNMLNRHITSETTDEGEIERQENLRAQIEKAKTALADNQDMPDLKLSAGQTISLVAQLAYTNNLGSPITTELTTTNGTQNGTETYRIGNFLLTLEYDKSWANQPTSGVLKRQPQSASSQQSIRN